MRQDRSQVMMGDDTGQKKKDGFLGRDPSIRTWSQCFSGVGKMKLSYLIQRLFSMAGDKGGDGGVHLFSCTFGEMEVVSFAHAVEAAQEGIAGDDAGSGDGGVGVLRLCFKMDAGDHLVLSLQIAIIAFFLYELVDDDVVRQSGVHWRP